MSGGLNQITKCVNSLFHDKKTSLKHSCCFFLTRLDSFTLPILFKYFIVFDSYIFIKDNFYFSCDKHGGKCFKEI